MRPIVFFDLETTGTNTVTDRIVQIAAVKLFTSFEDEGEEKMTLVNPGVPIPAAAAEVHKITDDMVRDAPRFSQLAKSLFAYLDGCDLAGFNITRFDVPLLAEEFARCDIRWPARGVQFFDAQHVFRLKEERTLSAAMRFYCQQTHEEAHDALGDVRATIRVMQAQTRLYEDLATPDAYAAFCTDPNAMDLTARIVRNAEGVPCWNFGKHAGSPVKSEPGFATWLLKQDFPSDTKALVRQIMGWTDKSAKP